MLKRGLAQNLVFIPPDLGQHQAPRNESPPGGTGNLSKRSPNPSLWGKHKWWNDPMATLELREMREFSPGNPRTNKYKGILPWKS